MLSEMDIKRLLDVANAACHHGHAADARAIYAGVLAVRPDYAPALIGRALSHVVVDDFIEAERILTEEVLASAPDDIDAKVLLGFTYMLAQRKDEAEAILRPAAEGDCPAGDLARNLLAQVA